jgi:flavin-dependent dehydrogenase
VDVDISDPGKATVRLSGRDGGEETVEARFVIDASGQGSLLSRKVGGREEEESLRKVAIFAHYRGMTGRCEGRDAGNTVIVLLEDAWLWVIPLSDEVTSVGLVLDRDVLKNSRLAPERVLETMTRETPYLAARMGGAERISQVYTRKDFSFTVDRVSGPNYCLVGDAAGFFDPIFSTGVFMAMKTAAVAADAVDARLKSGTMKELRAYRRSLRTALRRYLAFIQRFYQREFLEVFLQPVPRFGIFRVVVGVLAGDVFESKRDRWRLALFFLLTRIQRMSPVIAPRIAWDTLPRVGGMVTSEEPLV